MTEEKQKLKFEDTTDIDKEVEREVNILKSRKNGGEFRWARQILDTIPGEQAVKNAWKKYQLKYSTDKWHQKEKRCGNGKCGFKPREEDYWWFCSEKCKKSYCKFLKKFKEGEKAYQILTGDNTSTPRTNNTEKCGYCRQNYFFSKHFPHFKSLAKGFGRDETEHYWFCSARCYNNFFVCHFCGKKSAPGVNTRKGSGWKLKDYLAGTGYAFCSLDCQQKAKNQPNNQEKCFQCGGDFQKDEEGRTLHIYPEEDNTKMFCSSECVKKWREISKSQPDIESLINEAITAINSYLSIEPEVRTEELEPSNQNWAIALQDATQETEIRAIKLAVIDNIREKRAAKSGKSRIHTLLEQAKTKNDFEELLSLIKQLKELRLTKGYSEYQTEIEAEEARLKKMDPQKYNERINGSFDEKIRKLGLNEEEVSAETKAAIEEAERTGEPQKVKIAEELIDVDASIKNLNQLLVRVNQTQSKPEKAELLKEILIFVEENEFNHRAYQKKRSEVDEIVNRLISETQTGTDSPEGFPYLPIFLSLMAVLVVGASLFLIWKRKQRS